MSSLSSFHQPSINPVAHLYSSVHHSPDWMPPAVSADSCSYSPQRSLFTSKSGGTAHRPVQFPKEETGNFSCKKKKKQLLLGQRVHCSRALKQRWRHFMEPTKECKCWFRWWWVAFEAEGDKRTERLHSTWWWGPPGPQASSSLMTERGRIAPPCNPGSLWHECFPWAKITAI